MRPDNPHPYSMIGFWTPIEIYPNPNLYFTLVMCNHSGLGIET